MEGTRQIQPEHSYVEKLFLLIPGEVTAAFLVIRGILDPMGSHDDNILLLIVVIALLTINVPYLTRIQNVQHYGQIAFTLGAFILWVASIESRRIAELGLHPKYVAVALILYTLCIPFFVVRR